jgi:AbrB family looped-hinge helix DNA binding protein
MEATLSTKGQLVLPALARRKLHLHPGERLGVELREGGVFLRPLKKAVAYELQPHPVSGLPRMVARGRPARKVTAGEIARLNAELW